MDGLGLMSHVDQRPGVRTVNNVSGDHSLSGGKRNDGAALATTERRSQRRSGARNDGAALARGTHARDPAPTRRTPRGRWGGYPGSGGCPGADDHDRAWGVVDDVIGHAAQEELAHGAAPVAADDDEIDRLAARGFDDGFSRLALPDQECHANAGRSAASHEILGGRLAAGPDLVDANPEPATGEAKQARIDHAHDEQLGMQATRQIERLQARLFGGGRQIRREQDALRSGDLRPDRGDAAGDAQVVRIRHVNAVEPATLAAATIADAPDDF